MLSNALKLPPKAVFLGGGIPNPFYDIRMIPILMLEGDLR